MERKGKGGLESDIEDGRAGESIATAVVAGPYHHQDDADDAQDVHQGRQLLVGHPGIRSHGSTHTHTLLPLPSLAFLRLACTRAGGERGGDWRWRNGWGGRQPHFVHSALPRRVRGHLRHAHTCHILLLVLWHHGFKATFLYTGD